MGAGVFVVAAVMPSVAVAATPKCFGKPATIVSSGKVINGVLTVNGTKKDDVIFSKAKGGFTFINGKGGNDLICGGPSLDFIFGGPGNDKLRGRGGSDYLLGSTGNDHLYGDAKDGGNLDIADYEFSATGVDVNFQTGKATGEGTDTLHANLDGVYGSDFDDRIIGDDGTQFIWASGGNDEVDAAGGLDLVTPGDGNDTVEGGDDADIYYVNDATGNTTVDLAGGVASGPGIGSDFVTGFEHVVGSDFNDTIDGDAQDNIFFGGLGNDTMRGAGGFDYASYWFAAGPVNANLQTKSATGEGTDSFLDIEGLLGTINFSDTLRGDQQPNYIDGDGGDDQLFGEGGDDWFVGGLGDDTVDGGQGTFDFWDYYGNEALVVDLPDETISTASLDVDIIGVEAVAGADSSDLFIGDDANNRFYGWGGNDVLNGAGGDDQLDGGAGSDTSDPGLGADTCFSIESLIGTCENVLDEPIGRHPLQEEATAVSTLRRNF